MSLGCKWYSIQGLKISKESNEEICNEPRGTASCLHWRVLGLFALATLTMAIVLVSPQTTKVWGNQWWTWWHQRHWETTANHCQPAEMPAADKPELLSVELGRSQGLGVLMAKLFLPTLTSCTASGSVPGITFPGPSLLGSTSPASTECIHRYLTQINKREFLEIKSAISSR